MNPGKRNSSSEEVTLTRDQYLELIELGKLCTQMKEFIDTVSFNQDVLVKAVGELRLEIEALKACRDSSDLKGI